MRPQKLQRPSTTPRSRHCVARKTMRGMSLVAAIFLLVVLAALAAAMIAVSTTHQSSSAIDVQGARAYQAARAGIEWGLYRQLRPIPSAACFATTTFALPAGNSLSGFTVTVTCSLTSGPGSLQRWQLTSTACNQPNGAAGCPNATNNPDYLQRVMQVEF
ncbi:agglutinin biogenesis protein MshP [Undibacterium sp.]|uniref:agglutinin biogenesis protein MshP n=1 Tax=Undibacterium sp. TaxID=1914977 RepID=UPI003751DA61